MTIGIDLTVLQSPHRMRGIGSTVINFINSLSTDIKNTHRFIFYVYINEEDPLKLLALDGVNYETRVIQRPKRIRLPLPGRLKIINGALNQARTFLNILSGDSRIKNTAGLDRFIQFDQNQPVPAKHKVASAMVLYDIIPYVMESDYLWSYKTARAKGKSRKGALRQHYHRRKYITRLRKLTKKATYLIAISQHTKNDFIKHVGIDASKITVCHLGITNKQIQDSGVPTFEKYELTSWGYMPRQFELKGKKFLLFVGGADPRRKLVELVAAFNNLRAQGQDIYLVFAGDTMKGAQAIPNDELRDYFSNTSYLDNIFFLGFVTDTQREWLYKHTLAFVYPSVYEGFGLPVLEAMKYGTPVITYNNTSIKEIGGEAVIYVSDFSGIIEATKTLLTQPRHKKTLTTNGIQQAGKYKWSTTTVKIISKLENT